MKKVAVLTLLVMSLSLAGALQAQEPRPVGEQFQINSYTTDYQWGSAVALDPLGSFVVVWESLGSSGTDTDNRSIQAQRYDADGAPVGGEFQVNSFTTGRQWIARIASDALGNFVVVWASFGSYGTDSYGESIQGQRYDAAGNVVGSQFQVNSYTTNSQSSPSIALESDGDFVVVWSSGGSYGTDTDITSIQAQRYDSDGAPVGGEFQVNSYTTSFQLAPSVAADADGDFVVVWQSLGSYGTDTDNTSIQAQRYDSDGAPVGGEFQVNTYTNNIQNVPGVAADALGGFVVVWTSWGSDGTDNHRSIQGQRYDADGNAIGSQFQVNSYTTDSQDVPSIALESDGDFVVVWNSWGSYGTDTSDKSIQAQRYDADGTPVGGEFQVNTYTSSGQWRPAVAADDEGNFVVVWESLGSYGTDTSHDSIQGQRYSAETIFTDGFESGDTSAWSKTVQ